MQDCTNDGLSRLGDLFGYNGISKYLDGEDVINLLQCGSRRINWTFKHEAISLRFSTTWHTRFTNMMRFFRFLAEYFSALHALEFDFVYARCPTRFSHEIGKPSMCAKSVRAFKKDVFFPKLLHVIVRECGDALVVIPMARFFNAIQDDTSTIFPVLQTLHVTWSSTNDRYKQAFMAFAAHTPESVTSLALDIGLNSHYNAPNSNRDDRYTIKAVRRNRLRLPLFSLKLHVYDDTLQWHSLESHYKLDDLVKLDLRTEHKIVLDCSVLPRSLQLLSIECQIAPSVIRATGCSVIHLENAPPSLEEMVFLRAFDIMVRSALPPQLQSFKARTSTLHDYQGNMSISLLPRGLQLLDCDVIQGAHNGVPMRMCEYLFGDLVHRNRDYNECMVRNMVQRPSHTFPRPSLTFQDTR